ncbi:MAG: D-alanyl-D-alanine carboxypeptidase [Actinomycetota bacterium]|nr:D-alanyl-D-alanine carboxypeptidase [Actinomycetota bacterium]
MKHVYTKRYLSRKPKASLSRIKEYFATGHQRRIIYLLILFLVLLFLFSCGLTIHEAKIPETTLIQRKTVTVNSGQKPQAPYVYAESAVLMDAESGALLYEKNSHTKLPMASTTKILTALVVREQLDLNEPVTITPEACSVGEQEIWLEPGETLTVKQLLMALLVQSANDAAYALALHTSGSIESFARLMNVKAQELGAKDSHFTNPHGLDQPEHYTTAYDLAIMGRELLRDPVLSKIVSNQKCEIPWPGHPSPRVCQSMNELLGRYPGANGIKTGYTSGAGFCLVASAEREGKKLISVAMNSEHRASDCVSLLDYGFSNTEKVVLFRKGKVIGQTRISAFPKRIVNCVAKQDFSALSLIGSGDVYKVNMRIVRERTEGVQKGQNLGSVECTLNGHKLYMGNVVAEKHVSSPNSFLCIVAFLWYSICTFGRVISAPVRALS